MPDICLGSRILEDENGVRRTEIEVGSEQIKNDSKDIFQLDA